MKNIVVEVCNISMSFNLYKEKIDNMKEYFIKLAKGKLHYEEFLALNNISLSIKKGESFALIGRNGSGKSTLLKLISGVMKPTSGLINIYGTVAPLIELGAGFDMELTARENIYLNGAVLGYSKEQVRGKFEDIVDFSELQEFLDVPVKNFSSGMFARLGFSIATMTKPDILIVDEILSVGDFKFQEKCHKRIKNLLEDGTTLLFVSHNSEQVLELCDKALWLDSGNVKMLGRASEVCEAYQNS